MNGFPVINVERTGQNIGKALADNHMSMGALGRILGQNYTNTVSSWVNGRAIPKTENLVVISKALNVPMDDLVAIDWIGREGDKWAI